MQLILFLVNQEGYKKLSNEMEKASKNQDYEKAAV